MHYSRIPEAVAHLARWRCFNCGYDFGYDPLTTQPLAAGICCEHSDRRFCPPPCEKLVHRGNRRAPCDSYTGHEGPCRPVPRERRRWLQPGRSRP